MKTAIIVVFLYLSHVSYAQPAMVVKPMGTFASYNSHSDDVSSLDRIPAEIRDSATSILKHYMGDELMKNLSFSIAKVIDTAKYLRVEYAQYVPANIPKYDLYYTLKIPQIGIEGFTVELRLSKNGKPLKLTWPRQGVKSQSVFLPRDSIRAFALNKAKDWGIPNEKYEVDFKYDEQAQKFIWAFWFPKGQIRSDGAGKYDVIYVNWLNTSDFTIETVQRSIVY